MLMFFPPWRVGPVRGIARWIKAVTFGLLGRTIFELGGWKCVSAVVKWRLDFWPHFFHYYIACWTTDFWLNFVFAQEFFFWFWQMCWICYKCCRWERQKKPIAGIVTISLKPFLFLPHNTCRKKGLDSQGHTCWHGGYIAERVFLFKFWIWFNLFYQTMK